MSTVHEIDNNNVVLTLHPPFPMTTCLCTCSLAEVSVSSDYPFSIRQSLHLYVNGVLRANHVSGISNGDICPATHVSPKGSSSRKILMITLQKKETKYCSVSTECSHHVTRHLKCSLNLVFISRQSVENYPIWYSGGCRTKNFGIFRPI
jgi:hypothetical protein